jgi:hypothetical protein
MYIATVTHDIQSNTLEATWLELVGEELKRVKSRNYSQDQKDEFEANVEGGTKYTAMAGW